MFGQVGYESRWLTTTFYHRGAFAAASNSVDLGSPRQAVPGGTLVVPCASPKAATLAGMCCYSRVSNPAQAYQRV